LGGRFFFYFAVSKCNKLTQKEVVWRPALIPALHSEHGTNSNPFTEFKPVAGISGPGPWPVFSAVGVADWHQNSE
jgi:hypothetical protein